MDSTHEDASLIQVIPGTGTHASEICLKSGNTTLTYSGKFAEGFQVNGQVGNEWLYLAEESSDDLDNYYKTYSAHKVSVSDPSVTTGSKIIIYTRAWNGEGYDFFAINGRGELVPCVESGDTIEWIGPSLNDMEWQFTEYKEGDKPTNYYEFYNEYEKKYLAPLITGNQILSDDVIGLMLNGRKSGQYYTPILSWDKTNFSYAGLTVDLDAENPVVTPCLTSEDLDF